MHEVKVHYQTHENENLWKEKVIQERKAGLYVCNRVLEKAAGRRNQSPRLVSGTAVIAGE